MLADFNVRLEQMQTRLQRLEDHSFILRKVFDYTDENATAVSVPEFKASIRAWRVVPGFTYEKCMEKSTPLFRLSAEVAL